MGDTTGISWADKTFNPWLGCEKVSPGCAHCYAETLSRNRMGLDVWGPDAERRVTSASTWAKPLAWNRESERFGRSRIPGGQEGERIRVFCASMADVFEPRRDLEEPRLRLFELIARTPSLDWLILTKRPDVMRDWLRQMPLMAALPLPNVWLGTSIENARHTWRADVLREIPAVLRFISAEPLLGSLYPKGLGSIEDRVTGSHTRRGPCGGDALERGAAEPVGRAPLDLTGIDWVIAGGESGSRADARPVHVEWVRELRDAVQAVSIDDEPFDAARLRPAFHFKQWGSWTPDEFGRDPNGVWLMPDGARHSSFAADVYGIDLQGAARVRYAGPHPGSGGKFLDGTDWCEFPDRPEVGQLTLA